MPKPNKISDIVLVFGRRGCGKSHWTKAHIRTFSRYLILDPQDEYEGGMKVYSFAELKDALLKNRFNDYFKLIYVPDIREDIQVAFQGICDAVYEIGDMAFIVEEIGIFMSATSCTRKFLNLVRLSRHKNVNIVGITQRATDVPRLLRSQATKILTFQQVEPRDMKYLSEFLGEELSDKVRNFKQYHYLVWKPDGTVQFCSPIKN